MRRFSFHLARVTASSNIVLTATGNVRRVVYTDYVNIIADALKAYGNCTAKVHETWSKFLIRGVPAYVELESTAPCTLRVTAQRRPPPDSRPHRYACKVGGGGGSISHSQ
jgi:hypothetical protein